MQGAGVHLRQRRDVFADRPRDCRRLRVQEPQRRHVPSRCPGAKGLPQASPHRPWNRGAAMKRRRVCPELVANACLAHAWDEACDDESRALLEQAHNVIKSLMALVSVPSDLGNSM